MRPPRWKIRTRLQVWTAGVAGLVLCAVVGWGFFAGREAAIRDTRERALFVAESAAAVLDGYLLRQQGTVEGLAAALIAHGELPDFNQVREIQNATILEDAEIFGVCVALDSAIGLPGGWTGRSPYVFREKNARIGFRDLSGNGTAHEAEDWFRLVKERGAPVWTAPYWWDGVLMVTYAHPLWLPGESARRFAGVVTCDLTLDWLDEKMRSLPVGADGYGLLMDRTGLYVSHPMRDLVLAKTVFDIARERGSAQLEELGKRMVGGKRGVEEHTAFLSGKRGWVAYLPLDSADWIFAAVVSHDALRERLTSLARQQILIGLGGIALLAGALSIVSRSITRPIEQLTEASKSLAAGDLDAVLPVIRGGDEVANLGHCMKTMRREIRLRMRQLAESTAARERIESELRIAHEIQMSLVPKTFPPIPERPDLDLRAELLPAREVGGDFYDFFQTPGGGLAVVIADVADKGVPAALYMAATRSLLRSFFHAEARPDPGDLLTRLNHELAEDNPNNMFVTLFCGVLNPADGVFEFSNAGHNPPLVIGPETEWISTASGPVAGARPGTRYVTERRKLKRGEYLVLYTDGITEAENPAHQFFGEDGLARVAGEPARCGVSCRSMIEAILRGVGEFAGSAPVGDDRTLLVLRLAGGAPQAEDSPAWVAGILKRGEELQSALDAMEDSLRSLQCPEALRYEMRLVLEELGTNSCKAAAAGGMQRLRVEVFTGSDPRMIIEDEGADFDPVRDAPAFDPAAPLADRQPGGVGLHLVRSIAREFRCEPVPGGMRLTIRFSPPSGSHA